jgi:hypothetical protein
MKMVKVLTVFFLTTILFGRMTIPFKEYPQQGTTTTDIS